MEKDGSKFVGHMVKHGFGIHTDSQGNEYCGDWFIDQRHGQGKLTFADGSCF